MVSDDNDREIIIIENSAARYWFLRKLNIGKENLELLPSRFHAQYRDVGWSCTGMPKKYRSPKEQKV